MNEAYHLNRAVELFEDGVHAATDGYLRDTHHDAFTLNTTLPGWKLTEFVSEPQREVNDMTGLVPFDEIDPDERAKVLSTLTAGIERFFEGVLLARLARLIHVPGEGVRFVGVG